MSGIELIAAERARQTAKGYDPAHDDAHDDGVLWIAGVAVATAGTDCSFEYAVKPRDVGWVDALADDTSRTRLQSLAVAGAMLSAEMDRLIRAGEKAKAAAALGRAQTTYME